MRKTSELLQVVKDNMELLRTGLCLLGLRLFVEGLLTEEEDAEVDRYVKINGPPESFYGYRWPNGEKEPRIIWLTEHIEKLKAEGK